MQDLVFRADVNENYINLNNIEHDPDVWAHTDKNLIKK